MKSIVPIINKLAVRNRRYATCLLPTAYCLLSFLLFFSSDQATAQVFPVQGNVSLTPPYNPYLSSLTAPGAQRLQLNLWVNDPSLSDYVCKLRVTIDGVGITLRTRATFVPQPITLPGGGIQQTFYGEDIADYFNPANLDFAGITRRDFEKTNRLPEGVYRFTIEVLDYNRGTVVSNRLFATAWIILNDPPLLNLPRNATKVSILDPTNIAFTWTPRHTASVNAAFSTEYVFRLIELPASPQPLSRGEGLAVAANQALLTQPPLLEVVTDQSSLIYGPGEPALLPGRLYAWQVQARDREGADLFKNLGKSEVFLFQFGDALGVPQNVRKESGNATSITLRWDVPDQGDMPEHYRIQYKPTISDQWYDVRTQPGQRWHNVYDLVPGTTYQLRVRAEKGKNTSEYSAPVTIPTEDASSQFQCGNTSVIPSLTPAEPLFKLLPGDRIIAARFPILITEVNGSNGVFEGKGWLKVPAFNGIGIKVKFNGKVDVAYQLDGSWESTSSPNSRMTTLIEEMEKIGEARLKILLEESDSALNSVPPAVVPIIIAGEIESVTVNAQGEIVIAKEDGTTETIAQPTNPQGEKQTVVVTDSAGNQYTVDADGKVTRGNAMAGSGTAGTSATAQADPIKDRIIVVILEQFEKEIATWLATNGKGGEDDPDVLLVLALPQSLPQDYNILKHLQEETIPYYKRPENTSKLRATIEAKEENKQRLDKLKSLYTNPEAVDWNKVAESDKDPMREATGSGLMEELAAAINTTEEVSEASFDDLFKQSSIEDIAYIERIYWRMRSENGGSDNFKNFEWTTLRRAYFLGDQNLWKLFRTIAIEQGYLQDTKTDFADFLIEVAPDIEKLSDEEIHLLTITRHKVYLELRGTNIMLVSSTAFTIASIYYPIVTSPLERAMTNPVLQARAAKALAKIAEKAKQVIDAAGRVPWKGFANIFKATADEVTAAALKIKNYRNANNLKGGNYGYLEGTVNGKAVDGKMWRSVALDQARKETQIFEAIEVTGNSGTWLRITDSEYRMLNSLASELKAVKGGRYPNITGELKIVSENPYCASCVGIIQQLNQMFPNIKLILIDGAK